MSHCFGVLVVKRNRAQFWGSCFEVLVMKRNGALFWGSCGEKKWGVVLGFLW